MSLSVLVRLSQILVAFFTILSLISCSAPRQMSPEGFPEPTEAIIKNKAEKKRIRVERKAWIESLHTAAPGDDWKQIDRDTRQRKNQIKIQLRRDMLESGQLQQQSLRQALSNQLRSKQNKSSEDSVEMPAPVDPPEQTTTSGPIESLANGNLKGRWAERGSNNLSGRVLHTDIDADQEIIFALSAGGIVWAGDFSGNNWLSLNDFYRFTGENIAVLPIDGGVRRVIVQAHEYVHYSEDGGATWNVATGLPDGTDWGRMYDMAVVGRDTSPIVYISSEEWNYTQGASETKIYKSLDLGQTFIEVPAARQAGAGLRHQIWAPRQGSQGLYMVDNQTLKILQPDDTVLTIGDPLPTASAPNLTNRILIGGTSHNVGGVLYAAVERSDYQTEIFIKEDGVAGWTYQGIVPTGAFTNNSFEVSPENPNDLVFGGVEAFRSTDGGVSWARINIWWEYYSDPANKLHADIPHIGSFQDSSGNEFWLISTDGGVYESQNDTATVNNLSLAGLRISQYYSVYTNRNDAGIIFAGSQDQGFQRALTDPGGIIDFEQLISGDWGPITSGDSGSSIWAANNGGIYYFPQATINQNNYSSFFEDIGLEKQYFLPPIMEDPDDAEVAYVAGGRVSSGARLLRYRFTGSGLDFTEEPYDFSLGNPNVTTIAALAYSPIDTAHRYVMTTNRDFFHSTDGGSTWNYMSTLSNFGGHYLTGMKIVPSPVSLGTVYLGGSGYSNPAVYVSNNHGVTFSPLDAGLPNTLVFDMEITDDATRMYAATEVGPYVFVAEDGQWYDMAGISGPDQTFWSVDIADDYLIRFGTYGRGIWDFNIAFPTYNGKEYKVIGPALPADLEAEAMAWGGHLVAINDAAEEAWLRSTFGGTENFAIGFTDDDAYSTEGTFVWTNGDPVTYTNWLPGEPNDQWPGEDFALMNWGGNNVWIDFNDDLTEVRGIIEREATPVPAEIEIEASAIHPHHNDVNVSPYLDDVIPVVVYGSSKLFGDPEDLDTDLIDPASLAFGPGLGGVSPSHLPEFNVDVDGDGLDDARFNFLMSDSGFACIDSTAELVGELTTGEIFVGENTVTTNCNAQCHN